MLEEDHDDGAMFAEQALFHIYDETREGNFVKQREYLRESAFKWILSGTLGLLLLVYGMRR